MITMQYAKEILEKYNKEPWHIRHGEIVGEVMRYFARELDRDNAEKWAIVGLLHDVDFEQYPSEHCVKGVEILTNEEVDEDIIRSAMSHGWSLTGTTFKPVHIMEKVLFATDELTGLIGAVARMRPSKSVSDMEVSSVKKKFKDKKFAAGCSRDVIEKGAEMLGWTLDELIQKTIDAMRTIPGC